MVFCFTWCGLLNGIVYSVGWVFTIVIALLLVMLAWEWLKTVPEKVRLRLSEWRDESVAHLHDRLDASVKDGESVRRRLKTMRQEVSEVADKLKRAGETCDEVDFARYNFYEWEKSLRTAIGQFEAEKVENSEDAKYAIDPSEVKKLVEAIGAVGNDINMADIESTSDVDGYVRISKVRLRNWFGVLKLEKPTSVLDCDDEGGGCEVNAESDVRPSPEMSNLVGSVAAVVRDMRVVDDHFPGGIVDLVVGRDRLQDWIEVLEGKADKSVLLRKGDGGTAK